MLNQKIKDEIDNMSYDDMLRRWRFSPVGDIMFAGEEGEYFEETFRERNKKLGDKGHCKASKRVGWDKL